MTEKETVESSNEAPDIVWGILLVKTKQGLSLQKVPDLPEPDSVDELYKELVLLVRNFEHDHAAMVHAQKMMEAAMAAKGINKSGLITPGVAAA